MFDRKSLALVAACATLAFGGLVRAADGGSSSKSAADSQSTASQPVLLDDAAAPATPPPPPLTEGLDDTPLGKPIGDAGITISGYVEGSTTFIDHSPPPGTNNLIVGRTFDTESDSLILNQVDLAISRAVDDTKGKFDVGFNIEQLYGADAAYVHSNGMTVYSPSKIGNARDPKNQYDLLQANVVFALPVGKGMSLTLGKFNTLLGAEVIEAPVNALYSHSFLFGQLPFTQTGILGAYNLCDEMTVQFGVTRGWDQALKDVNGDLDMTGQFKYTKDKWTMYLNWSTGNQSSDASGMDGWRTVLDYVGTYAYSDNLSLTLNADYGWQAQASNGGNGQWYGIAGYASYIISDYVTFNCRAEWFDDPDGAAPASYDPGVANTYYEATFGVKVTPIPHNNIGKNLVFRPEIRDDYADHPVWGNPASPTNNQATLAIEGYFTF